MITKKCIRCNKQYPIDFFYVHKEMKDGRLSVCKDCVRVRIRKQYHENKQDPAWLAQERERTRERNKRLNYAERYRPKTEEAKKRIAEYRKRYIAKNPERRECHVKAGNALRGGKIKRANKCFGCDSRAKLEMHHEDYNKPLEVIWLCRKCHMELHRLD